jgi:hypothetical protein
VNVFAPIGRYFWLLCLGITAFNYVAGVRAIATKESTDPRASADAIVLRRCFALATALPWIVMGWGILIGGVPNIWYYFRPQDRNPYVLTWFGTVFLLSFCFALWVFLLDGAQKVVTLQPIEVKWYRTTLQGTATGTFALTTGRVKLFAAFGPLWIAGWTYLVSIMDAPVPK